MSKTKHARVVEKQFTVDKIFRMRWRVSGPVVPNCLPNVTFYRRDLVLVTIFFVMSTVHPNIAQLRKKQPHYAAKRQAASGSIFIITFIFVQNATIGWALPDYLRIPKADKLRTQLSVEQHKLNYDANSGISERHRRHRSVYNVTTKK